MGINVKKSRIIWIGVYFAFLIHLMAKCDFMGEYGLEYLTLILGYIIVGAVFVYVVVWKNADILEPIPMVLFLLLGLFSVAPIELTAVGITQLAGVEFMGGCIRVTLLYIFSAIACTLGYYKKKRTKMGVNYKIQMGKKANDKVVFYLLFGIWLIGMILGFWFQYKVRGMSFQYILSLGTRGTFSTQNTTNSSINFVLNFSYSSIVPWLYFLFYYKNKILSFFTTFCMLTLYIVCGWRNVVIIMGLAFLCLYYIKNNKRPGFKEVIVVAVVGLIFLGVLGAARGSLRTGVSVDKEIFSLESVVDSVFYSLETNFNLYQPFYAIAIKYPSEYTYSFGKAIFWDTLVTVIPRAIWPNKPLAWNNSLNTAMRVSTQDFVVTKYGMAVPSLGEYYVDFGFIGTILMCFLMGIVLKNQTRFYRKENNDFCDLIRYSVTFGVLFVLVMRGATPNNFYYLLFLIWPNWVVRYCRRKGR